MTVDGYTAEDGTWAEVRETSVTGAVLVRPRTTPTAQDAVDDTTGTVTDTLAAALAG